MSILIKDQLHKLSMYADYQNGYQRITNTRHHFSLSGRSWDLLLEGSEYIPMGIYRAVYCYLKALEPSEDLDLTQTDIAIENFKKGLVNGEKVCVD